MDILDPLSNSAMLARMNEATKHPTLKLFISHLVISSNGKDKVSLNRRLVTFLMP